MKCCVQIIILLMIITVDWISEVKCKPRSHIRKNVHVERTKLPEKHISLFLEKLTPFGKFEFKHVINKRQAELPGQIVKEEPIVGDTLDAITTKEISVESHSEPEVIITSVIKPFDNGKSLSLSLPFDSELLITKSQKIKDIIEKPENVVVLAETEPKPEVIESSVVEIVSPVVEITPKPLVALPPLEKAEPEVLINAIETPVVPPPPPPPPLPPAPVVTIPIYRNLNYPYVRSFFGNDRKTFLYTDITKIPLSLASNPESVAVPVPEVILPPQPLPPPPEPLVPPPEPLPPLSEPLVPPPEPLPPPPEPLPLPPEPLPPPPQLLPPPPPIIKEDPLPKQETPNFFVKGSRLVLFVGSMMLQMLSKFVNGGFNINQIPIPIIPEVQ